ncbi:S-layer homology domain-containing protein [Serinibacter salmoneus]|nr:S-layer homology domain-containing protein [Serinibacter salmoneus]
MRVGVATAGQGWQARPIADRWELTVSLPERLPVRAAAPTLLVDGIELPATESPDGLSLTATTTLDLATTHDVSTGWSGEPTGALGGLVDHHDTSEPSEDEHTSTTGPAPVPREVLAPDPRERGAFTVARADYDLGTQAVDLVGLGDRRGELRAAVYYPAQAAGERPVVMLLHGRHEVCTGGWNPARYPCLDDQVEVPSHLGFGQSAETLASQGYVVVSVSANAINAHDNVDSVDYGATARGALVLSHLDLLERANAGEDIGLPPELTGRLDLDRVSLMGHSRGGEGVVRAAALNSQRAAPFGIVSIAQFAPTDFARLSVPDLPLLTVLPYCDGDLPDLQGQHYFEDSRDAVPDYSLRTTAVLLGANHNYFNAVWAEGPDARDDWAFQDADLSDPDCGTAAPGRLTAPDQQDAGTGLLAGWARLTLGGEDDLLAMFDGSGALPAGFPATETVAHLPERIDLLTVSSGTLPGEQVAEVGGATTEVCASLDQRPVHLPGLTPCGTLATITPAQAPHWTPARFAPSVPAGAALAVTWPRAGGGVAIGIGPQVSAVGHESLTFRLAPGSAPPQDLTVRVSDRTGRSADVALSSLSEALHPLPGSASPLDKTMLRTVTVPLADLGVDLTALARIDLLGTTAGSIYLADVALTSHSAGGTLGLALPSLRIEDSLVSEGDTDSEALVGVRLSRAADHEVTAWVEAVGTGGTGAQPAATRVSLPAGETCAVVRIPIRGDVAASFAPQASVRVTAAAVTGAVTSDPVGVLTVREDDAVVRSDGTPGEMLPYPGPQADPCAPAVQDVFIDVPAEDLYAEEIGWLAATGVTTGWPTPQGPEYRRLAPVARDAMAAFLYRYAGEPQYTPPAVSPFVDVSTRNMYYTEIAWLADQEISTGWSTPRGAEFRPLEPIARDAMAAFLYRFAGEPGFEAPSTSPFTDVATSNLYYDEITWLAATGVSTGWPRADGSAEFRPLLPIARDAMAAFLYRFARAE